MAVIIAVACVVRPTAVEVSTPAFFPLQARWSIDLGQSSAAPPAFDAERAYVPLRDGTLTAVRLADGQADWSVAMPTSWTPAVGDDTLVVAREHELLGLRTDDATPRWSRDLGAALSAAPVWTVGWLVVVLESGELVVLRGADGFEFWRYDVKGTLRVSPSVAGNEIFVPVDDGRVLVLELSTGRQLWERRLAGSPQKILPLDDLFVGATDNFFYCLSRSDGRMHWRWRTGGDVVGLPAVDERQVMFVSLDNILWSLDRKSGVQRWRRPLVGRPVGGPRILGEMVLISGVSPELRAFDTNEGRGAGVLRGPGEFAAPPHVLDPASSLAPGLIILTGDGRLVGMFQAGGPPRLTLDFPPPPLLPGPEHLTPAEVLPLAPADGALTPGEGGAVIEGDEPGGDDAAGAMGLPQPG